MALSLASLLRARPSAAGLAIAAAAGAAVLALVPDVVVVVCLIWLLDGNMEPELLAMGAAAFLLAALLRHAAQCASAALAHRLAFDVQRDLRHRLLDHLARIPLGAIVERPASDLRRILLDDIEQIEDGIAHLVPDLVGMAVTAFLVVAALAWIDWRLALAATAPLAVGFVVLSLVMAIGRKTITAYQDALADMEQAAIEYAGAIPTLRLFGGMDRLAPRLTTALDTHDRLGNGWIEMALVPSVAGQVLMTNGALLVLPLGLWLYGSGAITLSILVLFLVFGVGLGRLYPAFVSVAHRFTKQTEVLGRIEALLSIPPLPAGGRAMLSEADRRGEVAFCNVSFAYGPRTALHDVSFRVPAGKSVALVGTSGAGKSTVARLVARLWDPGRGTISVSGVALETLEETAMAAQVSCVFQDVGLLAGSVADNIRLGKPEATDAEVERAARLANADGFIRGLPDGYATRLGQRGGGLSGGQRQRLAIARALLKDAPVLVLDEATAFLDAESEAAVQEAIARLVSGRTLIVIAHRLHVVAGCDDIVVLAGGRVVERGRHAELLSAHGVYARLWAEAYGAIDSGWRPVAIGGGA